MSNLLSALPNIRRARSFRLYAENGKRFLNCSLSEGELLLGAKPKGFISHAKNSLEIGLCSAYPNKWRSKLEQALLSVYSDYSHVYVFSNKHEAYTALSSLGFLSEKLVLNQERPIDALDEIFPNRVESLKPVSDVISIDRPFLPLTKSPFCIPYLPLPASIAPFVILSKKPLETLAYNTVSAFLLSNATRAFYDFLAFKKEYNEELWAKSDVYFSRLFTRKYCYLVPVCKEEEYASLFHTALEKNILLSPTWSFPSLIPALYDSGELAHLHSIS